MKYRSKSVEVEAIQLLWQNWSDICEFVGVGYLVNNQPEGVMLPDNKIGLNIPTLEGLMLASETDWIIKGTEGEFYPCKDSVFKRKYEAIERTTKRSLKKSSRTSDVARSYLSAWKN